jgi:hypothetical protein
MSRLLRCRSSRRLQVVLGLALMALVFDPSASGAAPVDTVVVTGSSAASFVKLNITAQSGTSGQNASGTVSFGVPIQDPRPGVVPFAGSVTCLSVTGPDRGAGAPGSPATAVLNFQDTTGPFSGSVLTLELVDNGGNGADIIGASVPFVNPPRSPTDCSPLVGAPSENLTNGRATVFDAPLLPSTKAQCKHGGWRNYSQFKSQGQCVAFVREQARKGCVAERARIGRMAFRAKYGLGRYHLFALRRCVNAATR